MTQTPCCPQYIPGLDLLHYSFSSFWFLSWTVDRTKKHFDPQGQDWSSSSFCCCILKSKFPVDIAEFTEHKNRIAKFPLLSIEHVFASFPKSIYKQLSIKVKRGEKKEIKKYKHIYLRSLHSYFEEHLLWKLWNSVR